MSRPWMPLYVGDYLADTRHLTTVEHGAYLLLIMHYWRTGGLPTEDTRLSNIAGLTHDEWSSSRGAIAAFFDKEWKHKRVEFELTEATRLSAAGRAGGLASGKARSKPKRTIVERSLNDQTNDPPTIREALQSQKGSEPRGSDAEASWAVRLWVEGKPALIALGVPEKRAGPMIGRWLKDAADDHQKVLTTILRARDACPFEPIPWITQSLKATSHAKTGNVIAAADRLVERLAEFRQPAPSELRGGEGATVVRAIPQRRGE